MLRLRTMLLLTLLFGFGCGEQPALDPSAEAEHSNVEPDSAEFTADDVSPENESIQIDFSDKSPRERLDLIVAHIQKAFDQDPVLAPLLQESPPRDKIDVVGVNLAWQQIEPEVQTLLTEAFGIEEGARILFTGPRAFRSTNAVLYLAMLHVQKRFKDPVVVEIRVYGPQTFVPPQIDSRFLKDGEIGRVDFAKVQRALMHTAFNAGLVVDEEFTPEPQRGGCEIRTKWIDTVLDDTQPDAPRSYQWRLILTARTAIESTTGQWEQLGGRAERMEIVSEFQALLNDQVETIQYGPLNLTPIGIIPDEEVFKARSQVQTRLAEQEKVLNDLENFTTNSSTFTPAEFLDLSETFKGLLQETHTIVETKLTTPE